MFPVYAENNSVSPVYTENDTGHSFTLLSHGFVFTTSYTAYFSPSTVRVQPFDTGTRPRHHEVHVWDPQNWAKTTTRTRTRAPYCFTPAYDFVLGHIQSCCGKCNSHLFLYSLRRHYHAMLLAWLLHSLCWIPSSSPGSQSIPLLLGSLATVRVLPGILWSCVIKEYCPVWQKTCGPGPVIAPKLCIF